jgi:hypothetical protein
VTVYTFPAEAFVVEGEPEAVREVSRGYGRFSTTAGQAAADLRGLDSGTWIGGEGDRFRDRVAELPPHLDTAHGAFAQVARALEGFAEALAVAQGRMGGVRADAEQTHSRLRAAQDDQDQPRVEQLEDDLEGHLSVAAGLRGQVVAAAQQAAQAIRAAGRASPTAGQSWLEDRWEKTRSWASEQVDGLKGWVAAHAEVLRSVAKALRVVGVALVAVGAVLAVLGVGGGVLAAGFLLWGAAARRRRHRGVRGRPRGGGRTVSSPSWLRS